MLNTPIYFQMYRNGRSQILFKKAVLKNFTILTGKHLCWRLFSAWNFIKKRFQHRCFPLNIAELLRIAIFIEHLVAAWRVITVKQTVASAAFLRCSFRKIFRNSWSTGRRIFTAVSDLSKVAPAAFCNQSP